MNIPYLLLFLILGLCVLLSYIPIVQGSIKKGSSDAYWFMAPKQRILYYVTIPIAALGMIAFSYYYINNSPSTGLFTHKYALEILLALFLVSSITWSLMLVSYTEASKSKKMLFKVLCSASLVVAGISSLLLLAGSYEDDTSPPYVRIGILLLCVTTVLNDCVGWNARFIRST